MASLTQDTITALATAPGRGGIGVIRVSGPAAREIARQVLGVLPAPRHAHYGDFHEQTDQGPRTLDQGIALFFPGPHSFTGEDVLELQGHGGPVILDLLLREVVRLGARLARPGEFSERAFLNDKLDLAQAEAIADLIDSASEEAARGALRSLQGEFSRRVHALVEALIQLRIYVEAAIDFPEEEIDFLADGHVAAQLSDIRNTLDGICREAGQGALLRDGMTVVIAGKPNAGKSSLLNALAGYDAAIVTDIAGTTRDVLRERIQIDGMPLHIIDTAGLRDTADAVEKIGIARAWDEISKADRILLVVDASSPGAHDPQALWPEFFERVQDTKRLTLLLNKCDLTGQAAGWQAGEVQTLALSAREGEGLALLREHLKDCMGFQGGGGSTFTARRRHLEALERAREALQDGQAQLQASSAGELLAEDLRAAQQALSEITGSFSSDELLGRIFSSFCIGK